MNYNSEKTASFLEAINKSAVERCDEIRKAADNYVEQELIKAQKLAKRNVKSLRKDEIDRLNEQNNSDLSEHEALETKNIFRRRAQITDEIFESVKEKIIKFTESEGYIDFLKKSVTEIIDILGEETVIILREQDKKYEEEILKSCKAVRYDSSIVLGGCKAENFKTKMTADDTLDQRIESEKTKFYSYSGLTVTV